MKTTELLKYLQNPGNQYRGKPFWSWNGELEIQELKRQIDIMKKMGFGGFFMHSRTGLKTEYLGSHWFECVRECAVYAYSLGMEAWLYDEDRWPSGTAGGLVTQKERNRLRFISLYDDETDKTVLARFAYKSNTDFFLIDSKAQVPDGYKYQVYAEELMGSNSFYNGYTYLDTLNPNAVKDFFESTLERYRRECGDMFGKEIKGIFTDEPHRGALFSGFGITNKNGEKMCPYTSSLFERYKADWNEDLREMLPLLYYGAYPNKTAYNYTETLQRLFLDSFVLPYHQWCKDNRLILTGHFLHEDYLAAQSSLNGSLMRCYPHMDYPGIDNLRLDNESYWAAKQCVSVAKQFDKPFVLSELYAISGWGAGLEDFKYTGDWQAFYGITLRCPHLSWYNMKGEAKRDLPMSILHQASIDNDWRFLEDYYARLSYIYTHSKQRCDVLVINRVEQSWETIHTGWIKNGLDVNDPKLAAIEKAYVDEFNDLRRNQVAFDYADEGILFECGKVIVENGKTYIGVGAEKYSILYDSGQYVRTSTRQLISEFKEQGGKVITDIAMLPKASPQHENIAVAVRESDNSSYIIAMNFSRDKDYCAVKISEDFTKTAYEYDARSNRVVKEYKNEIVTDFVRRQERIFILTDAKLTVESDTAADKTVILDGEYLYALSEFNALPLKQVNATLNGEEIFTGNAYDADIALRKALGLDVRHIEMLQPWFRDKFGYGYNTERGLVELVYTFEIQDMPEAVYLAYEGKYFVTVNGKPVKKTKLFWKDIAFSVVKIQGIPGKNTVLLSKAFAECDDIENVYIIGRFGISINDCIIALPEKLSPVLLDEQGLPYYAGEVRFFIDIAGDIGICHQRRPREIAAKVIAKEGIENISCYPYSASVKTKQTAILSVILSAEKLFN